MAVVKESTHFVNQVQIPFIEEDYPLYVLQK